MPTGYIYGVEELTRIIERIGKVPARDLTKVTKRGANYVRSVARANAPKDTGRLKRSIKLKSERRKVGKKVYQIKFISEGLVKTGAWGRAFYPASQEYGFKTRHMKTKKPGIFFLRSGYRQYNLVQQMMITDLQRLLRARIRANSVTGRGV